jgi:manganese transport protein
VPLILFTSDRRKMGPFANSLSLNVLSWLVAAIIAVLNGKLLWDQFAEWLK